MEEKKRTALVIAIAITVIAAVFVSFGVPSLTGRAPKVVLPDVTRQTDSQDGDSGFTTVKVTPETVQSVVATLARPESYFRKLTVRLLWNGGSGESKVQIWADGGYTKTSVTQENGTTKYCLVGDGMLYLWYEGDQTCYKTGADDHASDLIQRIPTYEDVLSAEVSQITNAGYETKNGKNCIYVEVREEKLGYLERYWIEDATGLLYASETESEGRVVYQMEETLETPLNGEEVFSLPDGTVLHRSSAVVQQEENSNR